ncbi:MAG: dihydroorotate dehydrogenase electron transfer subunit [Oscillospiraceae bacterium]|jgi:dihydroorotate dehydrogenase electron transfer subunit|nr:dihydroorotate dehydrogenase electron transfer subunit [Oscillospiraceae bacterium]
MKQNFFHIALNKKIAKNTFFMILEGRLECVLKPGQFINIKIDGFFLRRPISICDIYRDSIIIIYKIFGQGTQKLSEFSKGKVLDILYDLGNGFNLENAYNKNVVLVGGGVGVSPLYFLAKNIEKNCKSLKVILGFKTKSEVFFEKEFKKILSIHNKDDSFELNYVTVVTEDGSFGSKGLTTDVLKNLKHDYYFSCGPKTMLRAISNLGKDGEISLEERMACGFGVCMGCSCKTLYGNKRVCTEGPVFKSSEVIFE